MIKSLSSKHHNLPTSIYFSLSSHPDYINSLNFAVAGSGSGPVRPVAAETGNLCLHQNYRVAPVNSVL